MCKVCGHEHWLREPHIGLKPTAEDFKRAGRKLDQAPVPMKGRQVLPEETAKAHLAEADALLQKNLKARKRAKKKSTKRRKAK